eukprot:GFKZ01006383.1.p2 GENE.GFKZ01006383.1~~GFKZ01006383.1.p2  ORF type:complete len:109 (+),score=8.89 GFKZ01006383.1:423-749(+)
MRGSKNSPVKIFFINWLLCFVWATEPKEIPMFLPTEDRTYRDCRINDMHENKAILDLVSVMDRFNIFKLDLHLRAMTDNGGSEREDAESLSVLRLYDTTRLGKYSSFL